MDRSAAAAQRASNPRAAANARALRRFAAPCAPRCQVQTYERRCSTLEANVVTIYETAKVELQRKDREIDELRARLRPNP